MDTNAALDLLATKPEILCHHFGITRDDYLAHLAETALAQLRALGVSPAHLITYPITHAAALTGASIHELKTHCAVIDHGNRNKRISQHDLEIFLQKRKTPPKCPS